MKFIRHDYEIHHKVETVMELQQNIFAHRFNLEFFHVFNYLRGLLPLPYQSELAGVIAQAE